MRIDARRNRERLLDAARDVFVEQGVDAPLEDVAQRAGVGIATLYRRFPDRMALMRAVTLHVLVRVAAEARAALAEESDSFRALARYLHRCLDLRIAAVMPVLSGQVDLEHDGELRQARGELTPLRYLHLVGFGLLVGAWAVQYLAGNLRVTALMRTGLGTMIGTGLLLSIPFPRGVDLDYLKLGVKLAIALAIGALFGVAITRERAGKAVTGPVFLSIGGLALVNAAVAVFWR